jgi:antitoxin component HigA of HigAB toxin-antitoxin module
MAYSAAQIADLEARLARYLEAEAAALRNQSATLPDGRSVTRAHLGEIRKGIADLRNEIASASGVPLTRGRARRGVLL